MGVPQRAHSEVLSGLRDTRLDAAMIFPVNKILISAFIEGRGGQDMVALVVASKKSARLPHRTLITGENRRLTC
jgi:hypothetical protein